MKIIGLVLIFILLVSSSGLAKDDFGLRFCFGTDRTNTVSNYEFGANMDFIVFPNLFMQMGATFILPPSNVVEVAINSLGLEYNIPLGSNKLLLGTSLNRSYIKGTSGQGRRDLSYHLGYKLKWFEGVDVVALAGVIPETLLTSNPALASGNGYFFRTALEWYY